MNRLRTAVESLVLILSLSPLALRALFLLISYKISKFRARRAAMTEFRSMGFNDKASSELLEVVVPDIGGILAWENLMRSRNCCKK